MSGSVDIGTLAVLLTLKDQASAALDNFHNNAGGTFSKVKGLAVVAGVGIAAGLAAGAKSALDDYVKFQGGMNEVFTLLPGISGKAMGQMTDQTKALAKEMGVLPEKVVPALYQAISASVPQENVFEFLKVAQKAAVGGVTDLTVAVDGITSVVNAYGASSLSAGKASDLMFTAVKLGKTDFEQLSKSLFNVAPIASSLGVNFGDVTAALAAMTSQGIPTSVATTQLRQALVEMSQAGTKASGEFQAIAGKPFKEFIAGGGNVSDALNLMAKRAAATHKGVNDLFGSVEAGGAALALTGKNAQLFADDIAAMKDSAGATDKAYGTMEQGIGRSLDKLKAGFAVFKLDVGEALAPPVAFAINYFLNTAIPALEDFGHAAADRVGPMVQKMGAIITSDVLPVLKRFGGFLADTIMPAIQDLISNDIVPKLAAFGAAVKTGIGDAFEKIAPIIADVASKVADVLGPAIEKLIGFVNDHKEILVVLFGSLPGLIATVIKNWDDMTARFDALVVKFNELVDQVPHLRDALDKVTEGFDAVRQGATDTVTYIQDHWEQIKDIAANVWHGVVDVVATVIESIKQDVSGVVSAVQEHWDRISDAAQRAWSMVTDVVGAVVDTVKELISGMADFWDENGQRIQDATRNIFIVIGAVVAAGVAAIAYAWDLLGDPITDVVTTVFDGAKAIIQAALQIIGGIIQVAVSLISGDWQGAWDGVLKILKGAWDLMRAAVDTGINLILDLVRGIGHAIVSAVGDLGNLLYNVGAKILEGLWNGIESKMGWLGDKLGGIGSFIADHKGPPVVDAVLLYPAGQLIMGGLIDGLYSKYPELVAVLTGATDIITTQAAPSVSNLAATMAAAVAPIDEYRGALYGAREQLNDINGRLLELHRTLLDTKPHTAAYDAIKAQIAALQQDKSEISSVVSGLQEMANTASKGISALDGWNDALARTSRDTEAVTRFGALGVTAIDAFNAALLQDTPAAGAAAVKAIGAAAEAAHKAGVPNWQELADAQMAAYSHALDDRSEEAIQAALNSTQAINDAIAARAQSLKPTLQSAFADALNLDNLTGRVGSQWAGVFTATQTAIDAGKDLPVASLGKFAADALAQLQTLPLSMQNELVPEFQAAWAAFQADPNGETLAGLQAFAASAHEALAVIPKNMADLPPQVQSIIMDIAARVKDGSMDIEKAAAMAGDAAKLIPSGFRKMLPETQAAILMIVNQVQNGGMDIRDAIDRINDATNLIPKNLHELTPAVQSEIAAIVMAWQNGAIDIETATTQIANSIKKAADAAQAATAAAHAASSSGGSISSSVSSTMSNGIQQTQTTNALDIPGLMQSTVTEPGQQPVTTYTYNGQSWGVSGSGSDAAVMAHFGFTNADQFKKWVAAMQAAANAAGGGGPSGAGLGFFGSTLGDVDSLLAALGLPPQPHADGGVFTGPTPMRDAMGRLHVFGENGPEPFGSPAALSAMLGRGGNTTQPVVQHITIAPNLSGTVFGNKTQVRNAVVQSIKDAQLTGALKTLAKAGSR